MANIIYPSSRWFLIYWGREDEGEWKQLSAAWRDKLPSSPSAPGSCSGADWGFTETSHRVIPAVSQQDVPLWIYVETELVEKAAALRMSTSQRHLQRLAGMTRSRRQMALKAELTNSSCWVIQLVPLCRRESTMKNICIEAFDSIRSVTKGNESKEKVCRANALSLALIILIMDIMMDIADSYPSERLSGNEILRHSGSCVMKCTMTQLKLQKVRISDSWLEPMTDYLSPI